MTLSLQWIPLLQKISNISGLIILNNQILILRSVIKETSKPELDNSAINKMKVLELYVAIDQLGMAKNRLNQVLMDWLVDTVAKGVKVLEDHPVEQVYTRVSGLFDPGVYWK